MAKFERHIGELPWGWWLRAGHDGLVDDRGRVWGSVRDAFWEGELGFPPVHFAREQHELMLRVMTALHNGWHGVVEQKSDLFDGDMMFWRFHHCWLASIGMLETSPDGISVSPWSSALDAGLSALGRSVLMMLQVTREPEFEPLPMGAVVVASNANCGIDAEARERALQEFEREIGFRRHLFAREGIGTHYLVTLTGMTAGARMPTRNVAWSQSFADAKSRDDMFAWLAERVHRWDDWGELAHRKGADVLTRHLFSVVIGAGGLSK
ncbi:Heparinase [Sphingomonas antarctica]|uniref:hypothetical protein n=1 Tax=Sphingomonas antarctica TaxID=2040274 RepID=UPI0039E932DF